MTMTKRTRGLLLFGLPAGLGAIVVTAWLHWPRTAITRENVAKIRDGMTVAEVEDILGGPARDDSTGPVASDNQKPGNDAEFVVHPLMIDLMFGGRDAPRPLEWRSNETVILVQFGPHGRVILRHYFDTRRVQEGPFDVLRRWLRL
jgi:hypothetical protein